MPGSKKKKRSRSRSHDNSSKHRKRERIEKLENKIDNQTKVVETILLYIFVKVPEKDQTSQNIHVLEGK